MGLKEILQEAMDLYPFKTSRDSWFESAAFFTMIKLR
jgi:hypothetical protein